MSSRTKGTTVRWVPDPAKRLFTGVLTPDNFGIHLVRWPFDPALLAGGALASANPSRFPTELANSVAWFRAFDPNLFGRYQGGAFVQDTMSAEGTPYPVGRMVGGAWYQGMLRSDGTYDFSKLDQLLTACEARNLKVLLSIGAQGAYWDGTKYLEYPLPTGEFASTDWAAYQARLLDFLWALLSRYGRRIAALELANEPGRLVRLNTVVGAGHTEQLTVAVRFAKQIVRALGLQTLVLSPPFQGGEYGEVTSFLTTSAQGLAVFGDDGTGTKGRDWIDVVAHHGYGNFSDRAGGGSAAALDASGVNTPEAGGAYPGNTSFVDMIAKANGVAAACAIGGWYGPRWNTECNVTGVVGTGGWFPRKAPEADMQRMLMQMFVASFAGGYEKCFPYAADHPTLGFYDDNVGTIPAGEPADWWFKAPDNTARGARAMANAIAALTGGQLVLGTTGANPFMTVNAARVMVSTSSSGGVFA